MCALLVVAGLVFALFHLVGFDVPFEEDPQFNAPLLTDALLGVVFFILLLTVLVLCLSVLYAQKTGKDEKKEENNIPQRRIKIAAIAFTALLLGLSFAFSSSTIQDTLTGVAKTTLWAKVSSMFVFTVTVLIIVLLMLVAYISSGLNRKTRKP